MNTNTYKTQFEKMLLKSTELRLTDWRTRVSKLKKLHKAVLDMQSEIRQAIWSDFKKPAAEVDFSEIYPVTSDIKFTISHLKGWMKPRTVWPTPAMVLTRSSIRYEPKGIALIISPWNFPFQLAISPLISAVAAGNCVILKPSEMTPSVSAVLKKLVSVVFDPDEVFVAEGDASTAGELLKLPFNHVFFTGSPRVGKIVMEAASKHLADITLELGGKSPVIVEHDADLDDVADKLIFGKCMNAGQTCIAPDYALVHESVKHNLVEKLVHRIEKRYESSQNLSVSPDFARIINEVHFDRIKLLIEDAVNQGAEIIWGNFVDKSQRYISPSILTNITPEMAIMQEEIFGPVLPVLTYSNLDDALRLINSKPKPLALYVFSKSSKTINRVLANTSSGGTCINDVIIHFMHHNLPFGGVNNSGRGSSHGFYGFKSFSHERSILINPIGWNPAKWMSPPYTPGVRWLIDQVIRWF